MKNSLSKKLQNIILGTFVILAGFAGVFFLYQDIREINFGVSSILHELNDQKEREDKLVTAQKLFKNADEYISKLNGYIIKDDQVDTFADSIEDMGKSVYATTTILSLTKEKAVDTKLPLEVLIVSIHMEGGWRQVSSLINLLEHIPYASSLEQVAINADNKMVPALWHGNAVLKVLKEK